MLGALVGLRWHGVGMGKSLDGGGGLGNRDPSTTQRNSLRGFLCFAQDDNGGARSASGSASKSRSKAAGVAIGILRLRIEIRFANLYASLRMTETYMSC